MTRRAVDDKKWIASKWRDVGRSYHTFAVPILDYFKDFTDLKITVNEMFLSEDRTRLAIQWDWTVTRKRDRKRATTHDAILVHLVGGKIATWNEYFDSALSAGTTTGRGK